MSPNVTVGPDVSAISLSYGMFLKTAKVGLRRGRCSRSVGRLLLRWRRQPGLPSCVRRAGGEGVAEAHEGQPKQLIVGEQPLGDLVIAETHVAQAEVLVPA